MRPGELFEAVMDASEAAVGGGDGDAGGGDQDAPVDPGHHDIDTERTPPPESPEPEAAAPAFDYDAPEFQTAVEQAAQARLDAWMAEQNAPPPEDPNAGWQEALAGLDPLDDSFGQQLAQTFAEALAAQEQRILGEFQQTPANQAAETAYQERWETDQFEAIGKKLGVTEFDADLRKLATDAALSGAVQIGRDGQIQVVRDPGDALTDSTSRLHAYVTKREQAAVERYKAGLAGDGGGFNGNEPPAGGAGAVRSEAPARTAAEVTERFRARHGL